MEEERIRELESRIIQCKARLAETDYLALKSYEGEDMSKYGDWIGERKALREEINILQQGISAINPDIVITV